MTEKYPIYLKVNILLSVAKIPFQIYLATKHLSEDCWER